MDSADHHAPGRRANRLAALTSPYLLQHAHNPVDWWPWGPEAIAEARRREVPIFLSIGYATCYWCHVMERESFEHEPTAAVMNERFVCIKVDREERPDIDDLYMAATVTMTGHGGWPMSVFLEPGSLRPFWCGTYFPRQPRHGMPTFTQVLTAMSEAWATQRGEVLEQAQRLGDAVGAQLAAKRAPVPLGRAHAERAVQALLTMFDRTHGGFGGAPKFPQPVFLELLLEARRGADGQTASAIDAAVRSTLDAMMLGGIHDQVGGGFHRYSVDALWTVPHFEKMLYDNAQLLSVYARAAALYGDEDYARTARRTAGWMLREMVAPGTVGEAGFFSAIDAEVDGREGLNYLWTPDQVRGALPPEDAALAITAYGLDGSPNFRDPHHPDDPPAFVLRLGERPERIAGRMGMEPDVFVRRLDAVNAALLAARSQREQPRTDDKVLTAWNAMAIGALVRAGDALGEPAWVSAAARAAGFLTGPMRPGGVLLRSSRGGRSGGPGFLEDSAFLIDALLALHASPHARDPSHLPLAIDIARAALADFADADGALHDTRAGQVDLFVRPRSAHDGAVPSGAGVMAGALLDLAEATGDGAWMEHAGAALRGLSSAIHEHPAGAANACRHLLRLLRRPERPGSLDLSGAAEEDPAAPEGDAPVQVLADAESVTVREGEPAELHLALSIEAPYHIVAADPGPDGAGLIPLRVGLVSGQGVAVYADYPAGEAYGVEGMGTINVHTGQVALRVALERAEGIGAGAGRPVLGVSFQACTDRACLAPRTVALSVRIELG